MASGVKAFQSNGRIQVTVTLAVKMLLVIDSLLFSLIDICPEY
jgi:hypothetical protein